MAEQSYTLGQVEGIFERVKAKDPRFQNMSLRDFARMANTATGSKAFQAGDTGAIGRFVGKASRKIDEALQPISDPLGQFAFDVAEPLVGDTLAQTVGRTAQGLPRMAAQTMAVLPAAAAVTSSAPVTVPMGIAAALGLAGTAAQTFEETGSPLAAGVSAAGTTLLPAAGRVGTGIATKVARPLGDFVEKTVGAGTARAVERVAEYTGANLGASVAGEATGQLTSLAAGRGFYNPFTMENLVANVAGQLPFAAFDLPQLTSGYRANALPNGQTGVRQAGWSDVGRGGELKVPSLTEWQRMQQAGEMVAEATSRAEVARVERAVTKTTTTTAPPTELRLNQNVEADIANAPSLDDALAYAVSFNADPKTALAALTPEQKAVVPGVSDADKEQFVANKIESGAGLVMTDPVPVSVPDMTPAVLGEQGMIEGYRKRVAELESKVKVSGKTDPKDALSDAEFFELAQLRDVVRTNEEVNASKSAAPSIEATKGQPSSNAQLRFAELQKKPKRTKKEQKEYETLEKQLGQSVMPFAQMFTQDQLQAGFGLTGVEQTNAEKPFGVTKTKENALPTSGLWNRMKQTLPKGEVDLYEAAGIEKWMSGKKAVSTSEMAQWMSENGPRVEVKKLNAYEPGPEYPPSILQVRQRLSEVQHQLDSVLPDWRRLGSNEVPERFAALYDEEFKLSTSLTDWFETQAVKERASQDSATANFQSVNPKPLEQMPGAVDVLVRVPVGIDEPTNLVRSTGLQGVLHKGLHFGTEDQNILGWVRGYFETLPTGEKAFHVFEVQSDWGQERAKEQKLLKEKSEVSARTGQRFGIQERNDKGRLIPNHPLLSESNRLALKAAIRHAMENGAKYIALSDAETAMITEGHDVIGNGWENTNARQFDGKSDPKQAPGMRLNYDHLLPKILEELTGYKSSKVSFGKHKNTQGRLPANLTFKNPDGTPKTDIIARLYPLDKVQRVLAERLGFSFFSKDKIDAFLRTMESEGASPERMARAAAALRGAVVKPGETLDQWLERRAGLTDVLAKSKDSATFVGTVGSYFDGYFRSQGFDAEQSKMLTGLAQSVASKFSRFADKARVLPAWDVPSNFFATARAGRWENWIGLARQNFIGRPQAAETLGQFVALGHEAFHAMEQGLARGDIPAEVRPSFEAAINAARDMTVEERVQMIREFSSKLTQGREQGMYDYRAAGYDDPTTGASEFLADFTGLLAVSATTKEGTLSARDWAMFGNAETRGFVRTVSEMIRHIVLAVRKMFDSVLGKGADSRVLAQMDELSKNMREVLRFAEKGETLQTLGAEWSRRMTADVIDYTPTLDGKNIMRMAEEVTDGSYPTSVKRMDTQGLDDATKRAGFGQRMSWYHFGYPMSQLARRFPQLKAAVDLGFEHRQIANAYIEGTWRTHFTDNEGKFDAKRLERITKEGCRENRAFSIAALFQQSQEREIRGGELTSLLKKKVQGITPEEIASVERSLAQIGKMNVELARKQLAGYKDDLSAMVTGVLMSQDKSLKANAAMTLAQQLVQPRVDFEEYPTPMPDYVKSVLGQYQISDTTTAAVANLLLNGTKAYRTLGRKLLGKDLQTKPWFFSEVRLGEWTVTFEDSLGERHLEGYKTQAEAERRLATLNDAQAKGGVKWVKAFNKTDRTNYKSYLQAETVAAYREADSIWYDHALSVIRSGDAEMADTMAELYRPGMGVDRVLTSPYKLERNLVAGRERLNMAAGAVHYADSVAYTLAKRHVKNRQRAILNDPEMRANEHLRKWADTYLRAITDPEGKEFTALKNFVFFHYMGMSASHLFIEPTQLGLSHVPLLINNGDGTMQAFGRVLKAAKAVGVASLKRHFTREAEVKPDVSGYRNISQDEVQDLLLRATNARIVETGFASDIFTLEDQKFAGERQMLRGNGVLAKAEEVAKNSGYWLTTLARKMYSIAPRFNARVALLSAYEQARDMGKGHEDAVSIAMDSARVSMFGGGISNRPLALHGLGKAQGVGGLVYSLQSYTANMYAFGLTLLHDALKGQKPEVRANARRALRTMGAAQLAVGGAMGMPLASSLLAIWEQVNPGSELRENLRSALMNLVEDDEKGELIAEAALNGVVNAVVPIADIGSRFQLGGLFGVSPHEGLSWKNLFGPAAGLAESYASAAQGAMQGDWRQLSQAIPSGLRGAAKLAFDSGNVTDKAGRMLFEPSAAERALMVLGFKPRRLTQYYERRGMEQRAEEAVSQKREDFFNRMADLASDGQMEEVARAIKARQAEMPGQFDAQAAVRRIAQIVRERQSPRVAETNSSVEAAQRVEGIRRLYPRLNVPEQSQTDRYLETKRAERAFGVPGVGRISRTALQRAVTVDRIRSANPGISRQAAERLAEQMMNPKGWRQRFGTSLG